MSMAASVDVVLCQADALAWKLLRRAQACLCDVDCTDGFGAEWGRGAVADVLVVDRRRQRLWRERVVMNQALSLEPFFIMKKRRVEFY